jgi:hypothetical protein
MLVRERSAVQCPFQCSAVDHMQRMCHALPVSAAHIISRALVSQDMGFEPQIRRIVLQSDMPPKEVRQTLLFSGAAAPPLTLCCRQTNIVVTQACSQRLRIIYMNGRSDLRARDSEAGCGVPARLRICRPADIPCLAFLRIDSCEPSCGVLYRDRQHVITTVAWCVSPPHRSGLLWGGSARP